MRAIHVTHYVPTPIICTPIAIYRQRLLNVTRAIAEFDHSHDKWRVGRVFMGAYMKPCGSPACALGHYALRTDLQDYLVAVRGPLGGAIKYKYNGGVVGYEGYESPRLQAHFNITYDEANELFAPNGCGVPLPKWAADHHPGFLPARVIAYIRAFVARKYPQWERRT